VQVRNLNMPGVLGAVAAAIGNAGANIGNIQAVYLSQHHVVRDIDVYVRDHAHIQRVLRDIGAVYDVEVTEVRDEVLALHVGGKIRMVSPHSVDSIATLRKVYTPGVADVSKRIHAEPRAARTYTAISNMVAIVTDGTAVLGLGNVGGLAAMPVMEGKAALLSQLGDVSGIPILLDTTVPDEIVASVKHIAPTFGGIHLEGIAAPRCFEITERLQAELDTPVMHDDQHGTAAVVLGAALSAVRMCQMDLGKVKIGQIGFGAAGQTIADPLMHVTGNPVMGADIREAGRQRHASHGGLPAEMSEIMAKADIVIATTGVKGLIKPEMVRRGQVVLALSNPEPEIEPAAAMAAGAMLATDGRSVNNLFGYPGIWRGSLAAHARKINRDMLIALGQAIAAMGPASELLPNPLDRAVHQRLAHAVGKAAVASGVGEDSKDLEELEPTP